MAVFKSLTFDGINSLDYGIYITGEAVYNAPERVVEMVEIPGRNGALAIDQGYFENIEVSYPCGCFAETQAEFAEKVSAFRNAIGSRYSYKRLTDEYNTDEYRLGLYKSGLEVSAVRYGTAGQFTITFDCKPQRFLLDGDAELSPTDYSDVHTVSGDIVQIENGGSLGVKSLTADIEPIQSGSGTPSPTNIRPISGHTECVTYVSPTTSASSATTYTTTLGRTVYGGSLDVVSGVLTVDRVMVDLGSLGWIYTSASGTPYFRSTALSGGVAVVNGQMNALCSAFEKYNGSQAGFIATDGVIWVAPTNVSSNPYACIRDTRYTDATAFKTAMDGVQLVYELSTPQTYQLTPQEVELLLGTNNLWTDCGDSTVEYGIPPYYNPTEFDAKPLIKVTGTGTLGIGEYILTITGTVTQTLYIDCETMEIYTLEGTVPTGASSLVSINKTDFPVLKPGHNGVSVGTGLSALTITPKWWKI